MKFLASLFLILVGSTLVEQQSAVSKPITAATPTTQTTTSATKPTPKNNESNDGPKGTVVVPKTLGKTKIPGDSEVLANLGELTTTTAQYAGTMRELYAKYREDSHTIESQYTPILSA